MDVKNVVKSQATVSCLRDLSEDGDDLLNFNGVVDVAAGRVEGYCSRQVPSHPTDVTTCHTVNCYLNTGDSGSPQSLADVQACKRTGLGRPLTRNSLLDEQADTSIGNLTDFEKDDSENSATILEIYTEKVTSVNDDFSDDDLEYFECSDVLTVHEDEIWKKKLQFLLESDDEDDLKLSKDCDGCAYFLSEMPCVFQVSDNTTPMDTPIGFCEHQSKIKGVNVRRDPSMYSQSAPQTEMTLTVGHHRDKSTILKDKEENQVPVASAATGNEHPRSEEETNGSGHLAASSSRDEPKPTDTVPAQADSSANGIGTACTYDQGSGTMTETSHDGDVLGESSLLLEEGRRNVPEGNAQHTVCTLTESLRRNLFKLLNPIELCRYVSTLGQSFQAAAAGRESRAPSSSQEGVCSAQIPEEAESVQMLAGLCPTEEADKDSHWERERTRGLSEQNQMPDENISFGLCDEPGEGEQRSGLDIRGSSNPDILCSRSANEAASEAIPKSVLESGEPECKGDADVSAVHDKLWKLLHEDDSDYRIPFENRGIPSLGTRLTDIQVTELNFVQETCSDHPLPVDLIEEQEPITEPACNPRTEKADCNVSDILLQRAAACESASIGNICVAQVVGTDGVCLNSGTGNERETPSVCVSASSVLLSTQECMEPNPMATDRNRSTVTWEGKLAVNNAAQTCEADSSQRLQNTQSGNSACPKSDISAEQHSFFVDSTFRSDEGLKIDSSKNPTYAAGSVTSASALLPREAQSEHHSTASGDDGGSWDWLHSQQLLGNKILPFLTTVSHSESLPSESAVACSATRNEGKTGSIQTGVKVNGNLTTWEISCKSWKGLFQRVSGETKGEADLCENEHEIPRAIDYNPDEAEAKAPLHTLTGSQALKQIMNISTEQSCPNLMPSSKIAEAENSIKSTEYDKKEEVRTAESVASGLVNLPPVDSGNNQCFQEQPPHRRALSFPLAWTTLDPFPVNTESQRNQEGSKSCQISVAAAEPEPIKCKEDTTKSGHVAAGAKKKLPSATLSKKPRLEERGSVSKDPNCVKKSGKSEGGVIHKEERKEQRKLILKKDSKAPRLLKKIQAELFPDCSGSIKLCCQFGDVYGDSTITWTKDSKVLARLQRSAQDDTPVSLEIAEASYQDQGMYYCCLNNMYGKVTAEFHLTAAGVEEIEFMQLMFREDPLSSSYFGGTLHGAIMTEELHFGEGMHRRAFRSRVLQGLAPAFAPGHACVLKVHSALTYGTKSRDELLQKNYTLALQECYVQNTAREYAKLYAAEAEPLEGFGEVPEIIPIFLIHRPANNIPYATVEEELVGEFVKYSVKDGKEVNFLRRDSEAGQKCCTFQHWVYEKTNGNLLVTDLQGVGMKLTDVGIATLAKGYKGFKGNCSFSFIEQFRALHQCNEYCEMLGLKSLRTTHQKQRKTTSTKSKNLPNSSTVKKMVPKKTREPRDFLYSEH
ncbi:Alpha-protein kinase 2 [Lonchura striata]|uniref:non-specific serine/threonine protein kinase n=1 Tax=Lonchura striata TaxID=40157 RepID=A0A218UBW3_9PASE|nr:Alpha-protein kinase 2 [Lonchura striata domestica]